MSQHSVWRQWVVQSVLYSILIGLFAPASVQAGLFRKKLTNKQRTEFQEQELQLEAELRTINRDIARLAGPEGRRSVSDPTEFKRALRGAQAIKQRLGNALLDVKHSLGKVSTPKWFFRRHGKTAAAVGGAVTGTALLALLVQRWRNRRNRGVGSSGGTVSPVASPASTGGTAQEDTQVAPEVTPEIVPEITPELSPISPDRADTPETPDSVPTPPVVTEDSTGEESNQPEVQFYRVEITPERQAEIDAAEQAEKEAAKRCKQHEEEEKLMAQLHQKDIEQVAAQQRQGRRKDVQPVGLSAEQEAQRAARLEKRRAGLARRKAHKEAQEEAVQYLTRIAQEAGKDDNGSGAASAAAPAARTVAPPPVTQETGDASGVPGGSHQSRSRSRRYTEQLRAAQAAADRAKEKRQRLIEERAQREATRETVDQFTNELFAQYTGEGISADSPVSETSERNEQTVRPAERAAAGALDPGPVKQPGLGERFVDWSEKTFGVKKFREETVPHALNSARHYLDATYAAWTDPSSSDSGKVASAERERARKDVAAAIISDLQKADNNRVLESDQSLLERYTEEESRRAWVPVVEERLKNEKTVCAFFPAEAHDVVKLWARRLSMEELAQRAMNEYDAQKAFLARHPGGPIGDAIRRYGIAQILKEDDTGIASSDPLYGQIDSWVATIHVRNLRSRFEHWIELKDRMRHELSLRSKLPANIRDHADVTGWLNRLSVEQLKRFDTTPHFRAVDLFAAQNRDRSNHAREILAERRAAREKRDRQERQQRLYGYMKPRIGEHTEDSLPSFAEGLNRAHSENLLSEEQYQDLERRVQGRRKYFADQKAERDAIAALALEEDGAAITVSPNQYLSPAWREAYKHRQDRYDAATKWMRDAELAIAMSIERDSGVDEWIDHLKQNSPDALRGFISADSDSIYSAFEQYRQSKREAALAAQPAVAPAAADAGGSDADTGDGASGGAAGAAGNAPDSTDSDTDRSSEFEAEPVASESEEVAPVSPPRTPAGQGSPDTESGDFDRAEEVFDSVQPTPRGSAETPARLAAGAGDPKDTDASGGAPATPRRGRRNGRRGQSGGASSPSRTHTVGSDTLLLSGDSEKKRFIKNNEPLTRADLLGLHDDSRWRWAVNLRLKKEEYLNNSINRGQNSEENQKMRRWVRRMSNQRLKEVHGGIGMLWTHGGTRTWLKKRYDEDQAVLEKSHRHTPRRERRRRRR